MAEGRCETCRHWTRRNKNGDDLGLCGAITDNDSFNYRQNPAPNGEKAVLCSYDGSSLWTKPDFGCVLHQPAPVPPPSPPLPPPPLMPQERCY